MKAESDNPLNGKFFIYDPLTGEFSDDLRPLDAAQAVLIPEYHHSPTHEKVVLEALKWIASTRESSCLLMEGMPFGEEYTKENVCKSLQCDDITAYIGADIRFEKAGTPDELREHFEVSNKYKEQEIKRLYQLRDDATKVAGDSCGLGWFPPKSEDADRALVFDNDDQLGFFAEFIDDLARRPAFRPAIKNPLQENEEKNWKDSTLRLADAIESSLVIYDIALAVWGASHILDNDLHRRLINSGINYTVLVSRMLRESNLTFLAESAWMDQGEGPNRIQFAATVKGTNKALRIRIPLYQLASFPERSRSWIDPNGESLWDKLKKESIVSIPKNHYVRLPAPSHIHGSLTRGSELVRCIGGIHGLSTRIVPGEGPLEFDASDVISADFGLTEVKYACTSKWSVETDREGKIGLDGCDFMWQMVKEGITRIECGEREVQFYHLPKHVVTKESGIFWAHLERMTPVGYELEFTCGPELRYGLFGDAATREIRGVKMSSPDGMVFALKPQSP